MDYSYKIKPCQKSFNLYHILPIKKSSIIVISINKTLFEVDSIKFYKDVIIQ